jgi:hypothetical protein
MSEFQKLPASGMKDKYIAAKERWARRMAGNGRPSTRSADRLPPSMNGLRCMKMSRDEDERLANHSDVTLLFGARVNESKTSRCPTPMHE